MPPRFTYWTILLGEAPTAFRAAQRDELLPMLKQLQRQNPDATIKWFQRGRLWDSPEEADRERDLRRDQARERDQKWRPGGDHRDPRERYKVPRDVRRQKMARKFGWGKPTGASEPRDPGPGRDEGGRIPWKPRPEGGPPRSGDRKPWGGDRPGGARKPWGDRPARPRDPGSSRGEGGRIPWTPKGEGGPPAPRKPWGNRPTGGGHPGGKSRSDGPSGGSRPAGPRKPWSSRPPGKKSGGGGPPRGDRRPSGRRPSSGGGPSRGGGRPPGGKPRKR